MKKTVLISALFLVSFCFGQIGIEHVYYEGEVQRVLLENSGEKYVLFDEDISSIVFFNSDFSLWKSIPIPEPVYPNTTAIRYVSQTQFNSDDAVEVLYSTYVNGHDQYSIINEFGLELFSVSPYFLEVSNQDGLPLKLIVSNTDQTTCTVYSVPEFIPEHTFNHSYYPAYVKRIKLENSGEKYYVVDTDNRAVILLNADYSLWKTIMLPIPEDATVSGIVFVSENQINSDNLIEVGFYYSQNNNSVYKSRIVNESGDVIKTFESLTSGSEISINSVQGLANKLFIVDTTIDENFLPQYQTIVYSIPELTLEHQYDGFVRRVNLENSGEKYHYTSSGFGVNEIPVFNSDHSLWKTIPVSFSDIYGTIENVLISQTIFDSDESLEAVYTINAHTLNGGFYKTRLTKDDGTVMVNANQGFVGMVSVLPDLAPKLIIYIQGGSFANWFNYSVVLGANGSGPVFSTDNFQKPIITTAPNPAQTYFNVQAKTPISKIEIYDSKGILTDKIQGVDIQKVSVEHLSSGLYMAKIHNAQGETFTQKIIVKH